ncbi:cation diffusion facilitator family transporter [Pseudalkalibacillus caeni]|uniref:Cation transporter n=1 Tax=Exobacillus caeni TaxID=2574798 RepID=A0A5R9F7L7_9BACL|nr:cation diffusion facilitator family transporter [Pseudalkalibacillus caeni]TLS39021.1 cation transporter [Pseudalkalibacillus caeni]
MNSAIKGAYISITAYLFLSAVKLIIGFISESEALLADGFNNTSDIIASIAVLIGLKIAMKPRDENHPYGHSRAETISSLVASFIMMVIGLQVLFETGTDLFMKRDQPPSIEAAWAAAFGSCVMFIVYGYNKKLAEESNSHGLMAAAKDNLSDALVGIGTLIGIIGSQFRLPWLDPLTGVVIGVIICKTAWEIFRDASLMLTDAFDRETLGEIQETIKDIHGVEEIVDIKARMAGNEVIVDAIVEVDPYLNIMEGHEITDRIEETLEDKHKIKHAHIHIEPGLAPDNKLKD